MPEYRVEEPEAERLRVLIENLMRAARDSIAKAPVREQDAAAAAVERLREAEMHRRAGDFGKAFFAVLEVTTPKVIGRPVDPDFYRRDPDDPDQAIDIDIAELFQMRRADGLDYENALYETQQKYKCSRATVARAVRTKRRLDRAAEVIRTLFDNPSLTDSVNRG